jgi:pimeloyl-ACP methyl ester carboxylesterase
MAQSEELHRSIGGSQLAVLAEAGHLSNVEQPEAFNTQLLRFLRNQ